MVYLPVTLQKGLVKRGIPGVDSDAYHLGWFEDLTSHRSVPRVHSRFDPLIDTLKLFSGLILGYLIITFIAFAVREYTWSLNKRSRMLSSGSNWSNHSKISLDGPILSGRDGNMDIIQALTAYPTINNNIQPNTNTSAENFADADAFEDEEHHPTRIELRNNDSTYSVAHNSINISKRQVKSQVYGIRELLSLKPAEYHGIPFVNIQDPTNVSIKDVIKMSYPLQHVTFKHVRNAEKAIFDINRFITDDTLTFDAQGNQDNTTRTIVIFRLLAIGANASTFDNPNVFLTPFNLSMDELIDTGAVFDILGVVNVYFKRALMEMIFQYSYAHWNFGDDNASKINKAFQEWGNIKPSVQPHHVLFRYLINTLLGFHTVENIDQETSDTYQLKARVLLTQFAKDVDHKSLQEHISVLIEAIHFATKKHLTTFFYETLEVLIRHHANCCLFDLFKHTKRDLRRVFNTSTCEYLTSDIKRSIERIRKLSIDIEPELLSWWTDLDRLSTEAKKKPVKVVYDEELNADDEEIDGQSVIRPGSWRSSSQRTAK